MSSFLKSLQNCNVSQIRIMKKFKHTKKLKGLYREHTYAQNQDSTTDILLYLLFHILALSIHLSVYSSIHVFKM